VVSTVQRLVTGSWLGLFRGSWPATRSARYLRAEALRHPFLVDVFLLCVVVGGAGVTFARALHVDAAYDEGVYLASVDALAHGQKLGSEVFASQPPGFYVLLEAERFVFGGSLLAMRIAMLAVALVGCIAAYFVGRSVAGRVGGVLAMALLSVPSAIEDEAVRVRADFPSVALSLVAVALALFAVRRSGALARGGAVFAGVALAAAVSVKLLAATAVVPVLVIVLGCRRRLVRELTAGAASVAAALAGAYAGALRPLWNDVVQFHLDAQSAKVHGAPSDLAGNVTKLMNALTESRGLHSPFPWLVLLGALGALTAWRRRQLLEAVPLWLWAAVSAAFLAWHRPLWAHDIVMLTAGLAVAAGAGLATLLSRRGVAAKAPAVAAAVVIAATLAHHIHRTLPAQSTGVAWAATALRARTPVRSEVASDLPILPFLADRRQPGPLIDTSTTRVETGWLPIRTIIREIDQAPLSAVVLGHNLASEPRVVRAVRARFPVSIRLNEVSLPGEQPRSIRLYLPDASRPHMPSTPP
jgi:MYXO-CTERM domain-containing protein